MHQYPSSAEEVSLIIVLFFSTLVLAIAAALITASDPLFRAMIKFARESELIATQYVTDLPAEEVFRSGWQGMQRVIPFSVELSDLTETEHTDQIIGLGIVFVELHGRPTVYSVQRESPFFGLLRPADIVTQVGDLSEKEMSTLPAYMASRINDSVTFHYQRVGESDSAVAILRTIPDSGIRSFEVLDGVCYIAIKNFMTGLADEIADILRDHRGSAVKSILLDLRNSDGINVSESDRLATLFEKGEEALGRELSNLPLTIIIGSGTKGEAELFARRMVARRRAKTVGSPTLGLARSRIAIELALSKETLFVYRDPRSEDRADRPLAAGGKTSSGIIPDHLLDQNPLSPITTDLISQGVFFDFIVQTNYDSIPAAGEEGGLFQAFADFVKESDFFSHPFREMQQVLPSSRRISEFTTLLVRMQATDSTAKELLLKRDRAEMTGQLLKTILEVRLGREGTVAERIRCGDTVLEQALVMLRTRGS